MKFGRGASAGTHAFATWRDAVISSGTRYQFVYGSMRELVEEVIDACRPHAEALGCATERERSSVLTASSTPAVRPPAVRLPGEARGLYGW